EYYAHLLSKLPTQDSAEEIAKFFGMIENIDANFGKLLDKLDEWKLSENTLVIYIASDNGGTDGVQIFNAGLKGMKVQPWQGGTRTWSCWRWPAVTPPAQSDRLTAHVDVLPTLMEITHATMTEELK